MKKAIIKYILPILVIVLAVLMAVTMVKNRKAPKRLTPFSQGPMVEIMTVSLVDLPVTVRATGTVAARRQVEIIPQVNGVVEWVSPRLVQGAFFASGEELLVIEETDYVLALEQSRAELARAELDLALIESQAVIAAQEWRILNPEEGEPKPLVVYEPQLTSARAAVASAVARVRLAEVNVERTRIRAPFNCFIRTKNVEVGQYVRSGTMIFEVAGTDEAEIIVPVPLADLGWLIVPRLGDEGPGSSAIISMVVADEEHRWQGFVSRALAEVDSKTRMANVVIVIEDPYLLSKGAQGQELALGSFVEVEIKGRTLPQVARIPRAALQGEKQVWLVNDRNELLQRRIEVARKEKESVLVDAGLVDGERLVLTTVSGAANGLLVRPRRTGEQP